VDGNRLIAALSLGLLAASLAEQQQPGLANALIALQPVGDIFKNLLLDGRDSARSDGAFRRPRQAR